ncbi:DUF3604 domain-containing protein [Steroidobacter sp. S1-65]|uniref:DUF3604 domain-containing protein n=1 Tax=Steroidobacter gossypii TaxID=2805490 RepID=A0ABS1X017_9GAMM|nr:DUF3604 domain-containing protein [Steroidobacter gossypii]MBM0106591.1 DUF3604 domain-containing protein [Steroidobacter gossypii]
MQPGPTDSAAARGAAAADGTAAAAATPANPLRNVYFGDLHLHTRNSFDAYVFNVRASPEDAYAYAKGQTIKHAMGFDLRLSHAPLDFLAVTDHAEYLGVVQAIDTPGTTYSKLPYARDLFSNERAGILAAFARFAESLSSGKRLPELSDLSATRSAWQETLRSAERNNEPGKFTAFIGYEFTSMPELRNLHRNVIFSSDRAPAMPYSALESQNPEDLWRWMEQRRAEGMEVLSIPHNGNGSDGTMFERTLWNGQPIDRAYAELRSRNEPLVEITQAKGQSETMPLLSPNDELAGFELMTSYIGVSKQITKFEGGYARDALKRGMEIEREIGANPYKLGFVAGSDSHNSAGSYEEDQYFSKVGALDGSPDRRGAVPPADYKSWDEFYAAGKTVPVSSTWGSAGLTGIWAEQNTRESLFAALRRKETFATTGPRIRVRLFGGYELDGVNLATDDGVRRAYENAVPMGGDLVGKPGHKPQFVVIAMRDIHSAPLQRIQMVKGWLDASGKAHEKVFDVVCSDGGKVDATTQRCPDNGATVDLNTCEIARDKGAGQLHSGWSDPEFEPGQQAFYYARVIENPTCRWSTWDAVRAGVAPNPRLPKTIQERAYTSPIWFVPTKHVD